MTKTLRMSYMRRLLKLLLALLVAAVVWESYRAFGRWGDGSWPGTNRGLPVRSDDLTMPPIADIVGTFFDPVRRGSSEILAVLLLKAAWFTLKEAVLGFVIGTLAGLGLAVVMLRSNWLERGLAPWVSISQTIPLIALAPIVVTWGRTTILSDTQAVSLIAAYLTFFPVAVNGLAGLKSPSSESVELMRSFAAPWRRTLFMLRFPAAQPYLFPAFKLAATLSVVGAIVAEISSGVSGGLGRVILDFATRYSTGPERLYAAVIAAALLGLFVFALTNLAERFVLRGQMGAQS